MGLFAPKGEEFQNAPAGSHVAICYRVLDLGTQKVTWNGEVKLQHKLMIGWEMINELMEDGRPFVVARWYTLSGFANSTLRKDIETWAAKKYTDDEFAGLDLTKLVGIPAMLTLSEEVKDGRTNVNVSAVSKLPKGTEIKPLVNPKQVLILDNEQFDKQVFEALSDNLKKKIEASPEYQAIKSGRPVEKFNELEGDQLPF